MSTPKWAAGTLYPTGSLVQPLAGGGATSTAITNPGFESGSTDWTLGAGMSVGSVGVFAGTKSLACTGVGGVTVALHDASPVNPGQSITATCMYQQGAASAGKNVGQVFLRWFTSGMVQIGSDSDGSQVTSSSGGYKQSTVTAVAPATAAFVSIGGKVNRNQSNPSYFDNFAWNYAQAVAPAGLIYKAVQPTLGTSGATEPAWPATVGLTVVDNTVIWEALIATRITYEASPILLSGATEPTWPESIGDFVSDNTISWKAVPQQVVQAPNSKVVTIASSKVYAADGDIVRYCATVNPLDWTSADDAGYLPTGLNQYGSNRTAVLNTYRGNVVPFSASTFLCYQADPDPANITQLDAMEGIGSTYQQAAHPVANDLFYLSPLGVRTVGIAVGTANLSAGDAGAPIDPLVQAALVPAGIRPMAAYYPNQGQYWLCMRPPLPVVEGPTITGAAPDGDAAIAYPGYAYTVTPGDAPINSVLITDGDFPPGLTYDTAVIGIDPPEASGTYTFTQTVTDENGLTAELTDTIVINTIFMALPAFPDVPTNPNYRAIRRSMGGVDWSLPPLIHGGAINYQSIDSHENTILLIGQGTPGKFGYFNGTSWTHGDLPITMNAASGRIVRHGGFWYVSAGQSDEVLRSADGITFTQPSTDTKARVLDFVIVDGRLLGTSGQSDGTSYYVYYTDDPSAATPTWTQLAIGIPGATVTSRIATDGELCVIVSVDGAATKLKWSDDKGATWTAATSPFTGGIDNGNVAIHYSAGLGLWVASDNFEIAYSLDGKTGWTLGNNPLVAGSVNDYDSNSEVIMGASNNGTMVRSTDGMTWALITPSDQPTQMYDVEVFGD